MLTLLDLRSTPVEQLASRLPRPPGMGDLPLEAVGALLEQVRRDGDRALVELAERFDKVHVSSLKVDPRLIATAGSRIPPTLLAALEEAHRSIRDYHRHTMVSVPCYRSDGVEVEEIRRAVAAAGCYVPGGRARYPSSVLMTAVPAKVAGVERVVVCTPPDPTGSVDDVTLAAAHVAGVDEVYAVGGAQAVAAMAYGTETIRPVDVVAGPGNVYVSVAQRLVSGTVGVPRSFAGPSEVVVVGDDTTDPHQAALDVVVQAEHGPDGLAWLVTWNRAFAESVSKEVAAIVADSPRAAEIGSTLEKGGYAVVVDDPVAALAVSDAVAPEHLQLMCDRPEALVPLVKSAGAVFLGPWSPASVGDYMAGPSHVLPTYGSARFASVLGVDDFMTRIHTISVSREALGRIGPYVQEMAQAEGLVTHARSVADRIEP
ncbi:MAG: histidinol dehydrogenase [Actinomycetota bacterium]|nr:histidinol dehydrogenase [Actinomycetota bacterium]